MLTSISKVWFDQESIFVEFEKGQVVTRPLTEYPRLQKATFQQRNNYELWNDGKWLHWEELDEDLSAEGFLKFVSINADQSLIDH
jgi:hypothetical protein